MRRRILLIAVLLPALLMSGWGSVFAAALCAHGNVEPSVMAENHDCCRAQLEQQAEHCGVASRASSQHEEMAMSEMDAAPLGAEQQATTAVAFVQKAAVCLHCVSRGGLPTTFVITRESEQKKRDANIAAPQALRPTLPLIAPFKPPLTPTQNAPPGAAARRHLLLNIFVI